MTTHLVTVGTSLLANATQYVADRDGLDVSTRAAFRSVQDGLSDADVASFLGSAPRERVSAEVNALHREVEPGDPVTFFHSDTPDGRRCAELLRDQYRAEGHRSIAVQIDGLTGRSDPPPEVGLRTFVELLISHIRSEWKPEHAVRINATGGFKAQTGLAVLIGALYQAPVYYIFESHTDVVRLPALPLAWDPLFAEAHEDVLTWLFDAPAEGRDRAEASARLASRPPMVRGLTVETSTGVVLSASGVAFLEWAWDRERPQDALIGPVFLSREARKTYDGRSDKRQRFDTLLRLVAEPGWRDRTQAVGGGAYVAPANRGGQNQKSDERIAFVRRSGEVLVCELFAQHQPNTREGKQYERLKGSGFSAEGYAGFEPWAAG